MCVCSSTRVYLPTLSACTRWQRSAWLIKSFYERQKVSCSETQDDGAASLQMEEVSEREPEAWDMQVKRMKCRKLSDRAHRMTIYSLLLLEYQNLRRFSLSSRFVPQPSVSWRLAPFQTLCSPILSAWYLADGRCPRPQEARLDLRSFSRPGHSSWPLLQTNYHPSLTALDLHCHGQLGFPRHHLLHDFSASSSHEFHHSSDSVSLVSSKAPPQTPGNQRVFWIFLCLGSCLFPKMSHSHSNFYPNLCVQLCLVANLATMVAST